jgi:hypothetical protein
MTSGSDRMTMVVDIKTNVADCMTRLLHSTLIVLQNTTKRVFSRQNRTQKSADLSGRDALQAY